MKRVCERSHHNRADRGRRSDWPLCVCVGVKFEMTAPVLVEVPEEVKMWEPAIYTLSFLLPSAYQERPPTPTNDKVIHVERCEREVRPPSGVVGGARRSGHTHNSTH